MTLPDTNKTGRCADGGKGAFVNVVGIARSRELFSKNVAEKVKEFSAKLASLEDVEPFDDRASKWEIDDDLRAAAAAVHVDGDVALATLDIYLGH